MCHTTLIFPTYVWFICPYTIYLVAFSDILYVLTLIINFSNDWKALAVVHTKVVICVYVKVHIKEWLYTLSILQMVKLFMTFIHNVHVI